MDYQELKSNLELFRESINNKINDVEDVCNEIDGEKHVNDCLYLLADVLKDALIMCGYFTR